MADFGLVGGAYEAESPLQDTQELINWYCEIDAEKDGAPYFEALNEQRTRGVVALYPTPGFGAAVLQPQSGPVRGMRPLSGGKILLFVIGSTVYSSTTAYAITNVGSLLTTDGVVTITDNGIAAMLFDGPNRYSYVISSGAFAVISSADGAFFGGQNCTAVDNFIVYNLPGSQQFAATTALSTATPALSFASKFGSPDNLVSLITVDRDLFLLGEQTCEPWIDTGSFPFPFQIIPGTNTQHGCTAPFSPALVGDTFAFLSKDTKGNGIVRMAQGYNMGRISTHAVELSLVGKVISDAIGFGYQINGHEFYVLTFPTADLTWVYDLTTTKWHKWLSVDANNVFHRCRANCYAFFNGQHLIGDYQNGGIFALDNTIYTENGTEIRRVRRCPHLVSDFKREFFNQLQIQFQPGIGLATGQGSAPQAMLRWSDDGGSTFGNEHWKSIGLMGQYKNRIIWRRLGQARDRIYEVVVTDPIKAVIVSADLIAEVGAH